MKREGGAQELGQGESEEIKSKSSSFLRIQIDRFLWYSMSSRR
ncbi:unnamed protein product [Trifolium pratense]|nr:unnamed protein product [Trifolium pratense]